MSAVKIQAPANLRPGETYTVEGVTPTEEQRREAIDGIRAEVLALLESILRQLSKEPLITTLPRLEPVDDLAAEALQAALEQQQAGGYLVISETAKYTPGPLVEVTRRLLWLLGLSDAERAFVDGVATSVRKGTPADAVVELAIFAEWLGEQFRHADGSAIEALIPPDGAIVVVTVPLDSPNDAVSKAYAEIGVPLKDALERLGRRGYVCAVREGNTIRLPSRGEMRQLGWLQTDEAFDATTLGQVIRDEPEAIKGRRVVDNATDVITRLKWENAMLRSENADLRSQNEFPDPLFIPPV